MQLNAINRLQRFMGKEQKEALTNSFIFSNFNYCQLVWHFCSSNSSQKIEKIQLRCLRIIYNDYSSDYQTLLKLSQKPSMEIKRLKYHNDKRSKSKFHGKYIFSKAKC